MFSPPKSTPRTTNNEQRITNFLRSQPGSLKYPYLLLLLMGIAAAGLGLYHYFTGADATIQWVTVPHLQPVDALIDQFSVAGQSFSIKANGYLLTERFDVSLPFINVQAAYIYLGLLAVCLVFFLTAASTLKRWVFMGAMLLLMFFLVTLNLEGLELIPKAKAIILLPVMLGLALPAYAFQSFYPHVSFLKRLLTFTVLIGILGFLIFTFSHYAPTATTLHLVNHGTPAALVASILFIFWVSYEIIHFLVWINTQAKNPNSRFGLWQFMLVSLLFLGNLLLLYLEEAGILYLDLVYLDAFIVLFLSALAGFWGLRKREEVYGRLVDFWPGAAFLYLVFALITFLNIGYAFATANDPMIEGYNSIIVYIHLAIGSLFFLYVMVNFGRLLGEKLQVFKVIYDPKKLPFFTVYLMGTIATLGLFVKTNAYTYNQIKAGYYNYLGDLYKVSGEELLADRFYQESNVFDHYNIKSNYSLAGISREKNFRSTEIVYLKEALRRRPNEKIYARLASLFNSQEYFFEQQYTLKEALHKFPESAKLNNNMALLYNRTSLADSTIFYFNQAEKFGKNEEAIQSNKLAFFIKNALPEQAKLIVKNTGKTGYIPFQSNAVLLQHLLGQPTPKPEWPAKNTAFNPATFALLYHTVLNRLHTPDTSAISHLNNYIQTKENTSYAEDFTLLKGALQQYHNQPLMAKETLENLSRSSSEGTGYYQDILGQWFLKQEQYRLAADYFDKASSNKYPDAQLHKAWANALAGRKTEAVTTIQEKLTGEDKEQAEDAKHLLAILNTTPEQAFNLEPDDKVTFIQVQPQVEVSILDSLVASIKDPILNLAAGNAVMKRCLNPFMMYAAEKYSRIVEGKLKNTEAALERNRLFCKLLAQTRNIEVLKYHLPNLKFNPEFEAEKIYYNALIAENLNQLKEAKTLYNQVEKVLPYYEDALISAAAFFRDKVKDDMQAYNIIMTGITYNPFSVPLYKVYVLQSLRAGFENYAASGMEQLQTLVSAEEYATFNQLYQAELGKIKAQTQGWE